MQPLSAWPTLNAREGFIPKRVILWRHGQTAWNAERRFQGQSDVPLDATGKAQAARAAAILAGGLAARPGGGTLKIVSSDLSRAAATAQTLSELTGVGVELDPRLRETYVGVWQGMTFPDIATEFPEEIHSWETDEPDVKAGGGETRREVAARMQAGILDAVEDLPAGGTLVIATHGAATRVGLAKMMGLPEHLWRTLSGLSNCHWSILEESSVASEDADHIHWRLTEHNVGTLPEPWEKAETLLGPVED